MVFDVCWSGTSTQRPNLRLGSDANHFFQIAKTIWLALHPKSKHSYFHVERQHKTTEAVITEKKISSVQDE